jgi:hypothetical protein
MVVTAAICDSVRMLMLSQRVDDAQPQRLRRRQCAGQYAEQKREAGPHTMLRAAD